ncbi:hypothetical protein MPSEU_000794000 [Mayamaea pseudoterrestris]|nr:hypothetical protein MPSEU_000794000 [Mayamaea pseudoterrestris]
MQVLQHDAIHEHRTLIINGVDADPDAFPFFAYIGWGGGALIAPDLVLTAGHCLPDDQKTLRKMKVQVGKYYRNDDDDRHGGSRRHRDDDTSAVETFRVARAIQHPLFRIEEHEDDEDVFHHDYLLLKLDGRSSAPVVTINRDPSFPQPGDSLTVTGMGWIEPDWPDVFPKVLQTVQLDYLPSDQCARSSGRGISYRHKIQDWHLCTSGGKHNERDACAYDSGSPILAKDSKTGKQVLVGTVSWGEECADEDFPGVNSRTSLASEWIDAVVCEYSDDPPADFNCASRHQGSLLNFDEHHQHHPLELLVGITLMVASLLLLRWFKSKNTKRLLPANGKLDGFRRIVRQGSSYSYDSVGSGGVEIIT